MHCGDLSGGSTHCFSFSQREIQCLTELHYRQWDHEFLPAQETLLCTWPWPLTSLLKRGRAKIAFPCLYQYSITWHQGHSEIRETILQDMYTDPLYTATRLSFYFVLIQALTQVPRGLIFVIQLQLLFWVTCSKYIGWISTFSTKACDDAGLSALTVIIWPKHCPVNEPCSERNKMGWKQIGERGVHVKSVLKPEFSPGDEGLFLLLRLERQGQPTTGREETKARPGVTLQPNYGFHPHAKRSKSIS